MNNWQTVTLEDVAESINTGLDAIRRAPIVEHQTNLRCLRIQDISQDKSFNEWGFTETKRSDYDKYKLTSGDIIIARTGGSIGVNKLIRNDLESVFNNGLARIRVNKKFATPEFIYCVMQSINFKSHINAISSGTAAQPNMKVGDMAKFEFKLPPLNEQKKITDTIFAFIDKIHLNTQINQTLEQIAQALFKSWFVDFDPVRAKVQALSDGLSLEQAELAAMQAISGKTPEELTALSQTQPERYAELAETAKAFPCEMVEVDGVEVPKGWRVSTISESSLKIQNGGTPKRSNLEYWENGEIPWLSSGEVCNNKVLVQSKEYITDLALKGSAAKLIPPYSTLVAIYASPTAGKCAFSGFETSTNQAVCAIIPKEEYTFFNYYHLQLQEKYFANQASGSAQQNISKKIIEETPVLIPNKVILKKFNLLAKPIMNKTIENLKENNNLEKQRNLLLPKLLNGETS